VHEYASPSGLIVHADLYRLREAAELDGLGWDELLAGARLALVEWPERAGDRLPAEAWHFDLAHVPDVPDVRALSRR
jgi:tRNA A37 threonylcarbamoyladenosine biosynthesis protein TsaE